MKYVTLPEGFKNFGDAEGEKGLISKKKKGGLKLKIKISNPSLRRLVSGGIAGAVSRTAVAPLETIRTHLMVGSSGYTGSSSTSSAVLSHSSMSPALRFFDTHFK